MSGGTNPRARPGNGGAREGAGRKPGTGVKVLGVRQAMQMMGDGKTPLQVMLRNMHFWDEAADNMQEKIGEALLEMSADGVNEEILDRFEKIAKQFFAAREKAQACAVDAAPYVHAKLQSVVLKNNDQPEKRVVTLTLPSTAADRNGAGKKEDRSYRNGYGDPIPMKRSG